jgi:hypothetical protein
MSRRMAEIANVPNPPGGVDREMTLGSHLGVVWVPL